MGEMEGEKEEDRDGGKGGKLLKRFKRGWMWNQFFLQEEYTGSDKQYIGKVCPLAFLLFYCCHALQCVGKTPLSATVEFRP